MNHVRLHGDPFGDDPAAGLLRSFLRLALGNGLRCSLSLSGVRLRAPAEGERPVPLTDGVRDFVVGTRLPPAEIDLLLRAANMVVAATAPLVVFAERESRADVGRLAGLEWPMAATVLVVGDGASTTDLLERVRAEIRWSGCENPPHALSERDLLPWLSLPPVPHGGPVVHAGGSFAAGTDLVVEAWTRHFATAGQPLRLLLPQADDAQIGELQRQLAGHGAPFEILRAPLEPAHVRDAIAIVQPWRRLPCTRDLVVALASGRPLCASRFAANAALLARDGTCFPVGGQYVGDEATETAHFAPHPRALVGAWMKATSTHAAAVATGRRARQMVVEHLMRDRPAAPPPPVARREREARPVVVLEAPFFENSSSAELSIETARSLLGRGAVDLRLVARAPFRRDLATLRARAPELEPLFVRDPGKADLWLSAGWPVRADRPSCGVHALRVDWEYGALPFELTPHVTHDADVVVVHSEHVLRSITAAGRSRSAVTVVPHGVDAAMHEHAPPDQRIVQWKRGRPAVLFCGGPIWRKGFDVFLRSVLAARAAGVDFCVVVKTVGLDQHYGGFHLGDLLDRFAATPGTPPLLRIDDDLSRDELASVYTACDVMVHPYRGEGFCLPILEARACGLPVVATAGGAANSLLDGPGAVRIPSARVAVDIPAPHLSQPWVVEPSADDAARLLVDVLRRLPEQRAAARGFARNVRLAFAWDSAAAALERIAFDALRRNVVVPRAPAPLPEPVVTLPQGHATPSLAPVRA